MMVLLSPLCGAATQDLFELSLGELLDLQVTSVSKRPRAVSKAAAAVFVITSDDIRRSGATTIPDALRLAPGLQVANIDGNKWAISARGFNALYANKLLVLIDGRTVYSPIFSGTFWDSQDTVLQDIERIEVVRGPGATLWGSNAVNGVINIITRSSSDTGGTLMEAGWGNQERGFGSFRHGGTVGERGTYRVYGKYFERDNNEQVGAELPADDGWRQERIGFRTDWQLSDRSSITFQGDAFEGDSGENAATAGGAGEDVGVLAVGDGFRGHNLLGRWNYAAHSGDELSVQAFYDSSRANIDRYTLDLDVDYRTQRFVSHDLLLGVGYRHLSDDFVLTPRFSVDPASRETRLLSLFVQDDVALVPDEWVLTLGMKLERNDFTGTEYQPNLRLMWTPDQRTSVWGSVARAVRIPGRAEADGRALLDVSTLEGVGLPLLFYAQGSQDFESEELIAYEAGLKQEIGANLALDIAVFYNVYDKLRSLSVRDPVCSPGGDLPLCLFDPSTTAVVADGILSNGVSAETRGIEVATDWRPDPKWKLKASYSYLHESIGEPAGRNLAVSSGVDPRHQASLRASFNPRSNFDMDLWLRYTDTVRYNNAEIKAYTAVDARVAWRPHKRTELALVGRNLQTQSQAQFESEDTNEPLTALIRSVHLQLTLNF